MQKNKAFTDEVLEFAEEVFASVLDELQAGKWRSKFDLLPANERSALFASIADAFNAETTD